MTAFDGTKMGTDRVMEFLIQMEMGWGSFGLWASYGFGWAFSSAGVRLRPKRACFMCIYICY